MVASRIAPATIPTAIDLATFDGPLADALRDALRKAARADQSVQLTEGGHPLAQITPLHIPAESPRALDPAEIERSIAEHRRLVDMLQGAFPDGVDAVELIREQRRHSWEE